MSYENYNDHVSQTYRSGINKYMLSQGFQKDIHHELLKEFAVDVLKKDNINGNTAKQTLQLYASINFKQFKEWLQRLPY
jgi:predicted AlkP superfamily phosphohydrolase/phosphomutase